MHLSLTKFLSLFVAASLMVFSAPSVEAQSALMDDPKVKALVEAKLAKVRVLSDMEFESAAERGKAAIDANFQDLSKKDIKRLAKLGDAVWIDCAEFASYGAEQAKNRDLSDKKNLSRVYDERMRTVLYNHIGSKLTGHKSYKSNGMDFEALKAESKPDDLPLFMAARGLKCQLELIDTKVSGKYETAFGFYGKASSAADLYRKAEES